MLAVGCGVGTDVCLCVCLPHAHLCVQRFLLISRVQANSFSHNPRGSAHDPIHSFPAFLPQSALHQQLEKPPKLQELQWVSEIDGGGGTGKGEMA